MLRGMFGGHPHGDAILATCVMLQIGIVTFFMTLAHWSLRETNIETAAGAFAALDCDHCLGPDGVCHYFYSRKQQCLHLLPV